MHRRGAEVLHELELLLGIARAGRDYQAADLFGPVVGHQCPGEQAVGHHVLKDVARCYSGSHEAAGAQLGRIVHIPLRKKSALGRPVVPLEVCRRRVWSIGTASRPAG